MKTRLLVLLTAALSVGSIWAQLPPVFFQPLSQVKQFLQLSDSQLQTILTNNDTYNRSSAEKQNRIRQVQSEIADETGKSPLDPNALGVRYAEIETICRQMKEQAATSQQKNLAVLNDGQKSKLTILSDALKLAPVIAEAQSGNLLGGSITVPYGFTSASTGVVFGVPLGGVFAPANGCSLPFPVPAIRTGDFSGTATPQIPAGVADASGRGAAVNTMSLKVCAGNPKYCGIPSPWFDTADFVRVPTPTGSR